MDWRERDDAAVGHATGVRYVVARDELGWFFSWEFDPPALGRPGTVTCRFASRELARRAAEDHWRSH